MRCKIQYTISPIIADLYLFYFHLHPPLRKCFLMFPYLLQCDISFLFSFVCISLISNIDYKSCRVFPQDRQKKVCSTLLYRPLLSIPIRIYTWSLVKYDLIFVGRTIEWRQMFEILSISKQKNGIRQVVEFRFLNIFLK